MKIAVIFVFFPILLAMPLAGRAQQYNFLNYSVKNGLSNNVVKSIGQDELGFLYFGTNSGLSVYDGSNLYPFLLPEPGNQQTVFRIKRLSPASLWVNYAGSKQLITIQKGTAKTITPENRLDINNIYTGLTADTLICADAGLFKQHNAQVEKINTGISREGKILHFLYPVDNDKLLVGRKGFSLALINRHTYQKIAETTEDISVTDMVPAPDGDVWLGTDSRGFALLDGKELANGRITFKPLPPSIAFLANEDIFCLTRNEADKSLMIGTNHFGMIIYHTDGSMTSINKENGLASNSIRCIFIDRDNNWWVGSNAGVDKLSNSDFVLYGKNHGLESGIVYRMRADWAGRKWFFGKENMYYEQHNSMHTVPYPKEVEKITLGLALTKDRIWVSTPEHIFPLETNSAHPYTGRVHPTTDTYRRLATWDDETILLGGQKGLSVMRNGREQLICDTIRDIYALLKDRYNTIWIGTFSAGIFRIRLQEKNNSFSATLMQRLFDKASFYNRFINLYEDRDGDIWAGSRFEGLYIYQNDPEQATLKARLTTSDGLNNNYITGTLEASDGTIWVSSNTGFSQIRKKGNQFKVSNTSRYYSFNNPVFSLLADNGYLWGTTDIGVFRLKTNTEKRYDLEMLFKEVIFPDTVYHIYSPQAHLDLATGQNSFTVSFTSPFFTNEQQTRYHFRLVYNGKGDWTEIQGNHSITFNSLASGDYILEIRPTAFNNQPSRYIARMTFTIATPFYRTAWFISLIIAAILLLAWLFYRYRISELKKLYTVRDNISKNLHDEIGATLSSINIYSDVARKKIADGSEAAPLLDRIYKGSAQVMESMNDIVWYVNPKNDSWDDIIVRMREFAIPMLEARNIDVRFDADERLLTQKLSMKQRQNVYFIFKEAINNIAKYAEASVAAISLVRKGASIHLNIKDDGKGFDTRAAHNGNGLVNMQERAIAVKGKLEFRSVPGKGTELDLSFPIA